MNETYEAPQNFDPRDFKHIGKANPKDFNILDGFQDEGDAVGEAINDFVFAGFEETDGNTYTNLMEAFSKLYIPLSQARDYYIHNKFTAMSAEIKRLRKTIAEWEEEFQHHKDCVPTDDGWQPERWQDNKPKTWKDLTE